MEDIQDNMPTEGKKWYMSHSDWVHNETNVLFSFSHGKVQSISQLVCASNRENARKAVTAALEANDVTVLKCRIDYLIVGE
jgi:O6-methylguanine-DNA--protein-cysteine methyltransferase